MAYAPVEDRIRTLRSGRGIHARNPAGSIKLVANGGQGYRCHP
jgi:hypothetical protein